MNIFCPTCHRFVGERDRCRYCAWVRPPRAMPPGELTWQTRLSADDPLPGMPPFPVALTADHGLVFAPTEQGEVIALDIASGEMAWRRLIRPDGKLRTHQATPWQNWLLIGPEHVGELPEPGRALLAWEMATGVEAWQWSTPADNLSVPVVHADVAYFTTSEPRVYALDLLQRVAGWSTPGFTWSVEAPGLAADVVVAPTRSSTVLALRTDNGERLWTFAADKAPDEWLNLPPLVMPDLTYLTGWGKRLYAVDTQTGERSWQSEAPRGITCAPVLAADRLLIGVKDVRVVNGERKPAYGLWALDRATGQVAWQFATDRHLHVPPAVIEDRILCAGDDRRLHLLDAASGREIWQLTLSDRARGGPLVVGDFVFLGLRDGTIACIRWRPAAEVRLTPEVLLEQGRPVDAADALALRGEFRAAAQIFSAHDYLTEAAALYLEAVELGEAATLYTQLGDLDLALELRRARGDQRGEADLLCQQGKPAEAAPIYEEIGEVDLAVQAYVASGRAVYAAQLLRRVQRRKEAVALLQSVHEDAQAAETMVEDGDFAEAAQVYLRLAQPEVAAAVLAQGRLFGDAAQLNVKLGRLALAAEQFEQAGHAPAALALYASLADWKRVAELAAATDDHLALAQALVELGQPRRAADAYVKAGDLAAALDLVESLADWELAQQLAGQLAAWERQGHALQELGLIVQAGEAYERAAQALSAAAPDDERAALLERAAACYGESEEYGAQYERCWTLICRYRHWPNLRGRFEMTRAFYQAEFNQVYLLVRNVGHGTAFDIKLGDTSSKFELDKVEPASILRLGPQADRRLRLSMRPRPDVLGQVMLRVVLQFQRPDGAVQQETFAQPVEVFGRDEKIATLRSATPAQGTPGPTIYAPGGKIVMGGKLVEGDEVTEGGQKGDRVEVNPRSAPATRQEAAAFVTCSHCGQSTPAPATFCQHCQSRLE